MVSQRVSPEGSSSLPIITDYIVLQCYNITRYSITRNSNTRLMYNMAQKVHYNFAPDRTISVQDFLLLERFRTKIAKQFANITAENGSTSMWLLFHRQLQQMLRKIVRIAFRVHVPHNFRRAPINKDLHTRISALEIIQQFLVKVFTEMVHSKLFNRAQELFRRQLIYV